LIALPNIRRGNLLFLNAFHLNLLTRLALYCNVLLFQEKEKKKKKETGAYINNKSLDSRYRI